MFISIIMPYYNTNFELIKKSIESIRKQNTDKIELILVDDGSKIENRKILEKYLRENFNFTIKYIVQDNAGVSRARNVGLKNSSGEYILFLDSDDILSEEFYMKVKKSILLQNKPDILYFGFDLLSSSGKKIKKYTDLYKYPNSSDNKYLLTLKLKEKFWIWIGSAIYRKNFLTSEKIYFKTELKYGEDQDFIDRALFKAKKINGIKQTLVYYVQNEYSAMNKFNPQIMDTLKCMDNLRKMVEHEKELVNLIERKNILNTLLIANRISLNFKVKEAFKEINKIINVYKISYLHLEKKEIKSKIRVALFILYTQPVIYIFIIKIINIYKIRSNV